MKRRTSLMDNVTSNGVVPIARTKKLFDGGDYPSEMSHSLAREWGIIFDGVETLNKGFLTRLLNTSRRKLFKRWDRNLQKLPPGIDSRKDLTPIARNPCQDWNYSPALLRSIGVKSLFLTIRKVSFEVGPKFHRALNVKSKDLTL